MTARGPLPVIYFNGGYCGLQDAKVSVLDRGFLYGDGIYEIIPVFDHKPLEPQRHVTRLQNGLAAIRIDDPLDTAGWHELITGIVAKNDVADVSVYIQITRGAPDYRDHAFPANTAPTVLAMCSPLPQLDPGMISNGVKAVTRPDSRWARCDIKSVSLLANVLLRQEAVDAGAAETILYRDDFITEGSASSVFAVFGDAIVTPEDGAEILPGTTRDLILELASNAGLKARFGTVTRQQLRDADEVWLCSSLRELLPVTTLDDRAVGDGRPGTVFAQTYKLYQYHKQRQSHD
ncbi:MAG: aminotransferase class IV [Gammaproteobacteria bacterium]|nr:aminotransferase class IV [Gammaproteobacteria bacterium]NNF60762.1 D-amino acid aminotransferase [Gammaproteobacteria bacterium]NNM20227.1 D-amino acid aminotransferase [Gammaproteobacteria bacterium]